MFYFIFYIESLYPTLLHPEWPCKDLEQLLPALTDVGFWMEESSLASLKWDDTASNFIAHTHTPWHCIALLALPYKAWIPRMSSGCSLKSERYPLYTGPISAL